VFGDIGKIMNSIIPTTIVDGFFDDPLSVRRFALEQEYSYAEDGKWPGQRTKSLDILSPKLFIHTMNRFGGLFFSANPEANIRWTSTMMFQKISKTDGKGGWVHMDNCLVSGIIYLNDKPNLNSGTTIYSPKTIGARPLHGEKLIQFNKKQIDVEEPWRTESNNQYEESIVVKNKFNRALIFDGVYPHAANDFEVNDEDDRLILVFFVHNLAVMGDKYPMIRMRTQP
jgi:hypothetical protein